MKEIERVAKLNGFSYLQVPIENVFLNKDGVLDLAFASSAMSNESELIMSAYRPTSATTPKALLQTLFNSLKSPTTAASVTSAFLNRLLISTAFQHQCQSLIVGSNATTIAAQVVTRTAEGAGFGLPLEIALEQVFKEDGRENLVVFRPLRDLMHTEIEKYAEEVRMDLPVLKERIHEQLPSGVPSTFVKGLQKDFPQTVHTVTRTAFKIVTGAQKEGKILVPQCALCDAPVRPDSYEWRGIHTLSALPTTTRSAQETSCNTASACEQPNCCSARPSSKTGDFDLGPELCYACQNLIRDSKKDELVLPGLIGRFKENQEKEGDSQEKLRGMIEEFLLDDGEEE
ncbi:Cytoplasmic tRNA 2-thiolation protein 2 [Chytridiales sp. JEL 0842]|nr:Cytoplasmic tRNA 2-thiolation protein 2 [Chytridiales sp. JEL 0842]